MASPNHKQLENLGVSLPKPEAFLVDVDWKQFKIIALWLLSKIGVGSGAVLPTGATAGQVLRASNDSPFLPVWSTLPVSEGGNGAPDAAKLAVFGAAGGLTATSFTQAGSGDNSFGGAITGGSTITAQSGFITGDRFMIQDGPSLGAPDEFTLQAYDNSSAPAAFRAKRFEAKSPDGSLYQLTPPNGGGAASWVAA